MGGPEIPLHDLSIKEAAGFLRSRQISSTELVESALERIHQTQPTLRAFVTVMDDMALAAASVADAELHRGHRRGPLHGVPVGLKDIYDTQGVVTKSGSRVRESYVPTEDAEVVARLRTAGAIIVGKTVTHEFALGVTSPPARCAWDPDRIPGGSSGGSGSAVAAGACSAAMGTDTGCSVRNPAAINGTVGLKPTYGRVSRRGITPLSWSCDHAGPITRTVEDTALVLNAVAGRDPRDPSTVDATVPDFTSGLGLGLPGLRIGIPTNYFFDVINPDVERAVRHAFEVLAQEGAVLVEVAVPSVEYSLPAIMVISLAEAAMAHGRELRRKASLYGDEVRSLLEAGHLLTGAQYLDAQRVRSLIKKDLAATYGRSRLDLLATPTCPTTALPVGQQLVSIAGEQPRAVIDHYPRYASAFNLSGQPALTVPCGFDRHGLPIGLQLVGRPFDEVTVLRAGYAYESATDWHRRRPSV